MDGSGGFDGGVGFDGILVAAHELKGPLATLRQLALSFDGLDLEGEQIRDEMVEVSERAIRQVNDLSKMRRLEDGLFEMEPVAVCSVCDEVSRELKYLFRENARGLKVSYKCRNGMAVANRELLFSVVYNFLLNAIHYAGEGTEARMTVREVRDQVRVDIRDFGPALPMDIWREMRKGFVEKPTSIAMRPGSSGLGLFIASRFSRYMNAKVGAVRHRDGTSFYVELLKSKQASLFDDFYN